MADLRKYSLSEIDRMREAISVIEISKTVGLIVSGDRRVDSIVEEKLRTYMIAGIGPEELVENAHAAEDAAWRRQEKLWSSSSETTR